MSHFIPRVSSSPPPLDDQTFGWDDEDDDFGNFVGGSVPSVPVSHKQDGQQDFQPAPTSDEGDHAANCNQASESYVQVNGSNDDFADFAAFEAFQAGPESDPVGSKPQVGGLPLDSQHQRAGGEQPQQENNRRQEGSEGCVEEEERTIPEGGGESRESGMAGKRDSTTDSGMFSTDLSPIPASEDTTADFGDKSNASDVDDSVPDLSPEKETASEVEAEEDVTDKVEESSPGQAVEGCDWSDDGLSTQVCDSSNNHKNSKEEEEDQDAEPCSANKDKDSSHPGTSSEAETALDDSPSVPTTEPEVDAEVSVSVTASSDTEGQDDGPGPTGSQGIPKVPSLEFRLDTCEDEVESPASEVEPPPECSAMGWPSPAGSVDSDLDTSDAQPVELESPSHKSAASPGEESNEDSRSENSMLEGEAEADSANPSKETGAGEEEGDEDSRKVGSLGGSADNECHKVTQPGGETEASPVEASGTAAAAEEEEEEEDWADFAGFPAEPGSGTGAVEPADSSQPQPDPQSRDMQGSKSESEDEFGDFSAGGFESAPPQSSKALPSQVQDSPGQQGQEPDETARLDSDDEFGDFAAVKSDVPSEGAVSAQNSAAGGFAAFSENAAAAQEEEDEGWADFSGSAPEPVEREADSRGVQTSAASAGSQTVPIAKLPEMLRQCFPVLEVQVGVVAGSLEQVLGEGEEPRPDPKDRKSGLWRQLRDLETCNALNFQWSSSLADQRMFRTLRIDTKNILLGHKKQSVPIFAANIGLLEPIRGGAGSKESPVKEEVTLVNPNPSEDVPAAAQEIPPVEFDWDNSGLTNPLAAKTLDLDFLVQDTETSGKSSVFQSEVLDAPRSSVKSMQPLEDILKNMKFTTTTTPAAAAAASARSKPENLSEEAARIIAALPDLSFMQAKVLMFPVRQDSLKN